MATITSPPRNISLSKDDNFVVLTTDKISIRPAVVRLTANGASSPTDSQTFTLVWGANELVFTFASSPDNSAYQLPLKNGGESGDDYRSRLEEAFRQNEELVTAFEIINSLANQVIRLRFRQAEPIAISVTSTATGMPSSVESAGEFPSEEENLRAKLEVYQTSANTSSDLPLISLEAPYASVFPYEASFNLKKLAPVRPHLPSANSLAPTVPGVNDYSTEVATRAYRELYLRYADKHGTPSRSESLIKSESFYVIYGGSSGQSRRIFGSHNGMWICHSYYGADQMNFEKPITSSQPDYVFLFSGSSDLEIGIQIQVTYSDGSTDEFPVPGSPNVQLQPYTLYLFPSGPQQVVLDSAPSYGTKTIVAYEFRITNSTYQVIIRRVKYQLINACLPWQLVVAYSNGLGAIETVSFSGKSSLNYQVSRQLYQRLGGQEDGVEEGETLAYDQSGVEVYQVNTGYVSREYALHLRQLLLADTWLVDQRNLRFQRIQVTDTSASPNKDDQDLYQVSLSFRLSTTDESYHQL